MNNGKICVSVCAETADEFIQKIKQADEIADIIELRFDSLNTDELDNLILKISNLNCNKPFLATLRPKNKFADLTPARRIYKNEVEKENYRKEGANRLESWKKILRINQIYYVDFEYDIHSFLLWNLVMDLSDNHFNSKFEQGFSERLKNKNLIISEHFYENSPENLKDIFLKLSGEKFEDLESEDPPELIYLINETVKIAIQANEITDSLAVWKLLEQAKSENKKLIPIAMGEAGKWTRILGLAHGSPVTYASLESGQETAPGQVSAKDLIEVYRAKELDENTEVYGVIAGDTSYSMSPYIHNAAFKHHKLNAVFIPFQVNNLEEFLRRMVNEETREIELNFKGFAVTNPHKIEIMKYLDFIDEDAEKIGAVNTVHIVDGKFYGYNTDTTGFIEPLKNAYGDLSGAKVAVLGNGGAARACVYVLTKENADVTIFARNIEKAKSLANEFQVELKELPKTKDQKPKTDFNNFEILLNTTPLGTKGELENKTPATADQIKNLHLAYDLVYNPMETLFLREAKSVDVPTIGGLAMLIGQAMEQFKIWTGKNAPMKEMSRAALQRLS